MPCKKCGGKIIRKGIWVKSKRGVEVKARYLPYARVCEKCGRIIST